MLGYTENTRKDKLPNSNRQQNRITLSLSTLSDRLVTENGGRKKMGLGLISAPVLAVKYYTLEKFRLDVGHIFCAG